MTAYSMTRFHKLIAVENERVRGTFAVLLGKPGRPSWVKPFDVTVYDDESHRLGRVFYSDEMTGSVVNGEASIQNRSIPEEKRYDAEDAWPFLCDAIAEAVAVAQAEADGSQPTDPTNSGGRDA